jgi:hypothetical protein
MDGMSSNIAYETFKTEDGKTLHCVFNKDRKIEFLKVDKIETDNTSTNYEEGAQQTSLTLLKGLTFNSEKKAVDKVFKDCVGASIMGGEYYLVKSDNVTILIHFDSGTIDSIAIVNNKIVW